MTSQRRDDEPKGRRDDVVDWRNIDAREERMFGGIPRWGAEPKGWTIPEARVMDRLPIPPDRIDETLIRVEWPDPTAKYQGCAPP